MSFPGGEPKELGLAKETIEVRRGVALDPCGENRLLPELGPGGIEEQRLECPLEPLDSPAAARNALPVGKEGNEQGGGLRLHGGSSRGAEATEQPFEVLDVADALSRVVSHQHVVRKRGFRHELGHDGIELNRRQE